jgi:GABA(A) receptor-associated protein
MDHLSLSSILDTPNRVRQIFKNKNDNDNINDISFKLKHSLEKRKDESFRILIAYPERVPIICERIDNDIPNLNRKKYLVPEDLSMGNFMYIIRKRLSLAPETALYFFVNNKLIPVSHLMGNIYEKNKDEDGFLYIIYSGESTFG